MNTKNNKGAIEIKPESPRERLILEQIPFLTKHESRKDVFYFIENNSGVHYYKKNEAKFKSIGIDLDIEYKDYVEHHEPIPRIDLPDITLDPHQVIVLDKMLSRKKMVFPFGPGSGKTFMALTYINSVRKGVFLVLTPATVVGQYIEEAKAYLPSETIVVNYRSNKDLVDGESVVYVTNYEKMVKFPKDIPIKGLLFDESHYLKSFTSGLNKEAEILAKQSDEIFMFTGTPSQAKRDELLAQLKILQPYLVPTKTHFMTRYFYLNEYFNPTSEKRPRELDEIITRMTYGEETKNIVDLPPATHYEVACKFKDKSIYDRMNKHSLIMLDKQLQLVTDIDEAFKIGATFIEAGTPAVRNAKERQIASGYVYTKEQDIVFLNENPKELPFLELIPTLQNGIVFTRLSGDMIIVTKLLEQMGRSYVQVDGSTSAKDRVERIRTFKKNEVDFLVIQIRTGNAGLHLVNTTNIVYYSLPESSIDYEQSMYRIRRRGQTKECFYYSLIVKGTAERKNYNQLKKKIEDTKDQFKLYRRDV